MGLTSAYQLADDDVIVGTSPMSDVQGCRFREDDPAVHEACNQFA